MVRVILALWGLQVVWLIWHFGPEAGRLARRVAQREAGVAIRQENPLFRWAGALQAVIPKHATYVFLDDYAAGKEIQVRYFLAPRRHLLMSPQVPASFLFYTLHQTDASFLLMRKTAQPPGPGVQAARHCPAFQPLHLPGPGRAFRVNARLLHWGFYD
ncbi:MAG: hypothetical protein P8168_02675 [Deltaproteobacteria bacterium]